jgi:hypothetical protein
MTTNRKGSASLTLVDLRTRITEPLGLGSLQMQYSQAFEGNILRLMG